MGPWRQPVVQRDIVIGVIEPRNTGARCHRHGPRQFFTAKTPKFSISNLSPGVPSPAVVRPSPKRNCCGFKQGDPHRQWRPGRSNPVRPTPVSRPPAGIIVQGFCRSLVLGLFLPTTFGLLPVGQDVTGILGGLPSHPCGSDRLGTVAVEQIEDTIVILDTIGLATIDQK